MLIERNTLGAPSASSNHVSSAAPRVSRGGETPACAPPAAGFGRPPAAPECPGRARATRSSRRNSGRAVEEQSLVPGHVGDGVIERRQRRRQRIEIATSPVRASTASVASTPICLEHHLQQRRLVLAVAELARKDLADPIGLITVDAELQPHVAGRAAPPDRRWRGSWRARREGPAPRAFTPARILVSAWLGSSCGRTSP